MLNLNDFKKSITTPITVKNIIKEGSNFLIKNNILNGENEMKWYMQHLYQCNQSDLFQVYDNIVNDAQYSKVLLFLNKRAQKTPFQHIIGKAPFYGRDYLVTKDVLIPRFETEVLISIIKNRKCDKLLDIGTGSGCLGITAALEKIVDSIDLIDISIKALDVARKNSERFKIKNASYLNLDILNDIPLSQYDIILSNPPYVSENEYCNLDCEVRHHEPYTSLTDSSDGYTFYKRYAHILNKILKNKGIAVFEISHFFSQQKLMQIFHNFSNINFHKDLNGDYRALSIIND